jgi:hypothetical protein
MKLTPTFLAAAALFAGLSAPAFAVPYTPANNNIGPLDNISVDFKGASAPGAFVHDYFFTLAGAGTALGGAFNIDFASLLDIANFAVKLTGPGGYSATDTTPSNFYFAGLTPGSFTFTVSGNATGQLGGSYLGALGAVTAPVPEPGTMAMVLAGLGVVGWVSRRRRPGRD